MIIRVAPRIGPPGVRDEKGAGQGDEPDVGGGRDLDLLGLVDLAEAPSRGLDRILNPLDLFFGFLAPGRA